jgi:hypothetical protein
VSGDPQINADLRVQTADTSAAIAQASRFSQTCRVYAPMYRQVTLAGLRRYPTLAAPTRYGTIASSSLVAGFKDYLAHYNDGRPGGGVATRPAVARRRTSSSGRENRGAARLS